MPNYLIGVDAGGTYIKAALFDEFGNELALEKEPSDNLFLSGGRCERDSDSILDAVFTSIRSLLENSSVNNADIRAVTISGFGCGLWLLDEQGHAIHNGILSTDSRAAKTIEGIDPRVRNVIEKRVNSRMFSGLTLPLLKWFSLNEPELVARTSRIVASKDYIRGHLCGDFSTDFTDAGFTGLCDLAANDWAYDVLDLLEIPEWKTKLPEIGAPTDIVGGVSEAAALKTGLKPGTPVARGVLDVTATAIASGVLDGETISVISGTYGNNQTVHHGDPRSSIVPLAQSRYIVENSFLATEGGPTSASNLEWCIQNLFKQEKIEAERQGLSIYDEINRFAGQAYSENWQSDLLFFPYYFGGPLGAPAGFIGGVAGEGFAQMVLPIFQGIAFTHRRNVEMLKSGVDAATPQVVRMAGGGSNSDVWPQVFADVLELPVEVPDSAEVGALGAAITGAVAAGIYSDFATASQAMVKISRRYEPDPLRVPHMRAKYAQHKLITELLGKIWSAT